MHKPYRDIVKQGDVNFRKPEPRERKRSSLPTIPRSTVINFIAIALLFGLIFAMQHVSRNWIKGEETAAPPEVTAKAKAKPVTVTLDEATATVENETTDNVVVTTEETTTEKAVATETTETTAPQTTEVKTAVVTLEEDAQAKVETTESPATTKETVKTTTRRRTYRAARPASYGRDRYWQDRQVGVEELDNEFARERYKDLNREYSSGTAAETQPAPTYSSSYDYKARERYEPTAYEPSRSYGYAQSGDLDGAEARERYKSENKKLSGPDADLDY
jgi:hypothetical protein